MITLHHGLLDLITITSIICSTTQILDDAVAMLYVYKKIKDKITPEINIRVESVLDEWFGVEYEVLA